MMKKVFILLMLPLFAACGISSDNINGSHSKIEKKEYNVSNVMAGSVYSGTYGDKVFLDMISTPVDVQTSGEFYIRNVDPVAALAGVPVKAQLKNGDSLWSYLQGIPTPFATITITEYIDWNGITGSNITLQTNTGLALPFGSLVNINPFTNLAYWLDTGNSHKGFQKMLLDLNEVFFANAVSPDCQADKWLCKEHLSFFTSGNSIRVSNDGLAFSFKTPGFAVCNGLISKFPEPCFTEFSSVRHKRL